MKYWIKHRTNPQLGTYFVACGPLTQGAAKEMGKKCAYGSVYMESFPTARSYQIRLDQLMKAGERVRL
jgi:hypothetical protein